MNKLSSENIQGHPANRLTKEKSPYLLQHADNPVDWYPWGEEAFAKAQKEDKPILLSIGYSTCHWCHVMEHESFEDPATAQMMNEHFVSIKVDREERPDIDQIYMTAVMAMTGGGGWPLTVFLTPDKKPFFGGTYFPPVARWGQPAFKDVLRSVEEAWKNQRNEIVHTSDSLVEILRQGSQSRQIQVLDAKVLDAAYQELRDSFDEEYGGFGTQPKFPSGHNLSFLLRYWKRNKEDKALSMTEKTLSEMAQGGLYDHLGGGFHRYSTDRQWQIPHFEKMLYDQAILARSYLEAFQATANPRYAQVAREIFEYVLRDMRDPQGGFTSAEDADSFDPQEFAQKEGAFYLWKYDEIGKSLKPGEREVFNPYFGIEAQGNARFDPHGEFVGKNILYVKGSVQEVADRLKKSVEEMNQALANSKKKLLEIRVQRPRPPLDDKVLVDWNGLMISSLAFGSRVLDEPRYAQRAEEATRFILKFLIGPDGRLLHRFRDNEAGVLGNLSDYAYFIHGLLDLYEATFKEEYLKGAIRLGRQMINLFWDEKEGGFFFNPSDGEELILRQKEAYDGALPSANSIGCLDLVRLYHFTLDQEWQKKSESLLAAFSVEIQKRPGAYLEMLTALDFFLGPSREIVLSGSKDDPRLKAMLTKIYNKFIPSKVVILRPPNDKAVGIVSLIPSLKAQKPLEGRITVYVCENHICRIPVLEPEKLEELLEN